MLHLRFQPTPFLLGPRPFGDVESKRHRSHRLPLIVAKRRVIPLADDDLPALGKVLVDDFRLHLPAQQGILDAGTDTLRYQKLEKVATQDFFARPAEYLFSAIVPAHDTALEIPDDEGKWGSLVHRAVALLALSQCRLHPLALSDVPLH